MDPQLGVWLSKPKNQNTYPMTIENGEKFHRNSAKETTTMVDLKLTQWVTLLSKLLFLSSCTISKLFCLFIC